MSRSAVFPQAGSRRKGILAEGIDPVPADGHLGYRRISGTLSRKRRAVMRARHSDGVMMEIMTYFFAKEGETL